MHRIRRLVMSGSVAQRCRFTAGVCEHANESPERLPDEVLIDSGEVQVTRAEVMLYLELLATDYRPRDRGVVGTEGCSRQLLNCTG